jgi:glycosyltransferase involved in cell wall biosynthesis
MALSQLVSVIIPTYNRSALLTLTVNSVLQQRYSAVEVLVVDDGSTDDTALVLASYGSAVRVIHQQNQGGTAARNTGLREARGAYISVLDHDDLLHTDKLALQVAALQANPELGAVHCRWQVIDADGRVIDRIGPLPAGDLYAGLIRGCFIWSGGPLVRREWVQRVGKFDTAIWSSDWDYWLRLAQAGCRFGCVQRALGGYRILPGSTMSDVSRTEHMDVRLLDKVFDRPGLDPTIVALRAEAYGTWRFWLGRRYYAIGCGTDGRRVIEQALRDYPQLATNRRLFVETLIAEALDVRVDDALAFVHLALENLPSLAPPAGQMRELMLCRVHAGLALKAIATGDQARARLHWTQAARFPNVLSQDADAIATYCASVAMRQSSDPSCFAQQAAASVPVEARPLRRALRTKAPGRVGLASAFEAHFNGDARGVLRNLALCTRHMPHLLINRGVASMFMRAVRRLTRPELTG